MFNTFLFQFLATFCLISHGSIWTTPQTDGPLTIPIPLKKPTAPSHHLTNMTRDTLLYMISTFINPNETGITVVSGSPHEQKDWASVPKSAIKEEALNTFEKANLANDPVSSYQLFKELIRTPAHLKMRDWHHQRFEVPDTLIEFEKNFAFHNWDKQVIEKSIVKGTRRVIYRSPQSGHTLSIAQTVVPSTGQVRETELIIEREDHSGQFDFYAYDQQGQITQTSTFHTAKGNDVVASVPLTCLACHYNSSLGLFQRAPGSFSGK